MVHFNASNHTYSKEGRLYISATTLIKKYTQPFDSEFMSTYKGIKDTILAEYGEHEWRQYKKAAGGWQATVKYFREKGHPSYIAILARKEYYLALWKKAGDDASAKGNEVHEEREKNIKERTHVTKVVDGTHVYLMVDQNQALLQQDFIHDKIYAEVIVSNDVHCIAGMVDRVEKHKRVIHLTDYKTYKEVKLEGFANNMMKTPLEHIPDCNYQHAQLQLSLYGYMFEELGYTIGSLTMLHLHGPNRDQEKQYPMEYKRNDIISMIQHYEENLKF